MSFRAFREFDLLVEDRKDDRNGLRGLTVRLLGSPAGESRPQRSSLTAPLARELAQRLGALETRELDIAGVIGLGAALADLLFPPAIRSMLAQSSGGLRTDEGLRVRLRLDPTLAEIPWEFAWVAREQGQVDATGFLALDPRVSLVRHETVTGTVVADPTPRGRRVVAALANPTVPGRSPLDLSAERVNLQDALRAVPNLSVDFVEDPTIEDLRTALVEGADVFHFAGHGEDDALMLVGDDGAAWRLPAAQLAVNLRARGVQLAVLGACDSGGRAEHDAWSGVATRLISAGIPAVVAMQYRIGDPTAIAFSQTLYQSLAVGQSLDDAVSAARLAVFNLTTGGPEAPKRAKFWRDWGVPVLYLRPDAAVSLASLEESEERERLLQQLEIPIRVRVADVAQGGAVVGLEAGDILEGRIDVGVRGGVVAGTLEGVSADHLEGGSVSVDVETGEVGPTGRVVGARIASIGRPRPSRPGDDA